MLKKKESFNICLITDNNYAPYVGATIYSITKNAGTSDKFHFYIFDNGILANNIEKLKTLESFDCKIDFISSKLFLDRIESLPQTAKHISKTSYLKFFIADILKELDKVLYLDCDLIIKKSLWELYHTDIKDFLFGAVEDIGYTHLSKKSPELKLKFKCINSGVMLINCKKWRDENLVEQLLSCAANHEKVGYGQDQPVFNYVCRDKILFLDYIWNVQDSFFRDKAEVRDRADVELCHYAKDNPAIIHYTYVKKPWNYPFMKKGSEFWSNYIETPFLSTKEKRVYKILKFFMVFDLFHITEDIDFKYYVGTPLYKIFFRIFVFHREIIEKRILLRIFGIKISHTKRNS